MAFRLRPHPPGRGLHAPEPDEVPPPAQLIPDPDLGERRPDLVQAPPRPPRLFGPPPWTGTEPVCVWLERSDGTVAVCDQLGRIGILSAGDTEAYLPLVTAARAQDKVVAAVADIQITLPG